MGYWLFYYLVPILLAFATQHPAVALLVIVFYLARGFLPDPVVWLRTLGKIRSLRAQIAVNPANMMASRDLALLYLRLKRPKKAAEAIEHTRDRMAKSERHPQGSRDDAELLWLLGRARFLAGDPKGALEPLVGAVSIAPDIGRGDPYVLAAKALAKLGRWEEAEDALLRSLDHNKSSVETYVRIARARKEQKDQQGANDAIKEARTTWTLLPGFKKRHEWKWWLAALTAGVWL